MKICPKTNADCHSSGCNDEICIMDLPVQTPVTQFPNYGWICPKCGRGLSPYTSTCPCVPMPFQGAFVSMGNAI